MGKRRDIRRTANATENMAAQMRWQNADETERARIVAENRASGFAVLGCLGLILVLTVGFTLWIIVAAAFGLN